MISPHTLPGTKVICIDANSHGLYDLHVCSVRGLDGLRLGHVYTVAEVMIDDDSINGFTVVLQEIHRRGLRPGFALQRFKRLGLPKCLRDIEANNPIGVDVFEKLKRKKVAPADAVTRPLLPHIGHRR
jgi:hypothetical protein